MHTSWTNEIGQDVLPSSWALYSLFSGNKDSKEKAVRTKTAKDVVAQGNSFLVPQHLWGLVSKFKKQKKLDRGIISIYKL